CRPQGRSSGKACAARRRHARTGRIHGGRLARPAGTAPRRALGRARGGAPGNTPASALDFAASRRSGRGPRVRRVHPARPGPLAGAARGPGTPVKRRLKDRMVALLATLLMAGLVVGTWYLAESAADRSTPGARAPGHVPDYFVEGLAMIRLNGEGRPVFRMLADEMRHFPDDGTTEFDTPVLVSLDPDRPTIRLTAQRARTDAEGRMTELFDDVLLVREPTPGV